MEERDSLGTEGMKWEKNGERESPMIEWSVSVSMVLVQRKAEVEPASSEGELWRGRGTASTYMPEEPSGTTIVLGESNGQRIRQ